MPGAFTLPDAALSEKAQFSFCGSKSLKGKGWDKVSSQLRAYDNTWNMGAAVKPGWEMKIGRSILLFWWKKEWVSWLHQKEKLC